MKKLFKLLFVLTLLLISNVHTDANAVSLPKVGTLSQVNSFIESSAFSHDDKHIVTIHKKQEIATWNSSNATLIQKWSLTDGLELTTKVIYSHDSKKIITSDNGGNIKVWDPISGSLLNTLDSSKASVYDIVLNKDGSLLYSANHSRKSVSFWDMKTGEIIKEITFSSLPKALAYNPLTDQIAIRTTDGSLHIRSAIDGAYVITIDNNGLNSEMKYSSDYSRLFTTINDNQPVLFDVKNNYEVIKLNPEDYREKNGEIYEDAYWYSFDITPNDKYTVTGSKTNFNYLFDNDTKKLVLKFKGNNPLKFNHSGNRLLASNILFDSSQLPDRKTIGIELSTGKSIINTNEVKDIVVNELFSDGIKKNLDLSSIQFKSDNNEVANVVDGKLKSYKDGTVTITASYKGFTSAVVIKVHNFKVLNKQLNVPLDKVWNVKFNMNVDKNTINDNNIYITDESGKLIPISYHSEKGQETKIKLIPTNNYISGNNYTIWIKELQSETGVKLKQYTKMEFQIR